MDISLPHITINSRSIGSAEPAYIIAELSANHRQDFNTAAAMVKAAKAAGADAVKLQTYTPDTITIDSNAPSFVHNRNSLWAGKNLYQLYQETYTPWEWQPKLKQLADEIGIDLFASPFDPTAIDFLEQMNVPAYKISSFEIIDIPLIKKVAETGKPLIISTGMASKAETQAALDVAQKGGAKEIALLKCCSAYPAPATEINLLTIPDMSRSFKVPIGLSDHTLGIEVAIAAVALGACIIEKHFTLNRSEPSADAAFSLEPDELKALVRAVRRTEQALGKVAYGASERERESLKFRRSLFVVCDIAAGEILTPANIRSIRPADGLPPKEQENVLGRKTKHFIAKGTPLRWEDLQ